MQKKLLQNALLVNNIRQLNPAILASNNRLIQSMTQDEKLNKVFLHFLKTDSKIECYCVRGGHHRMMTTTFSLWPIRLRIVSSLLHLGDTGVSEIVDCCSSWSVALPGLLPLIPEATGYAGAPS